LRNETGVVSLQSAQKKGSESSFINMQIVEVQYGINAEKIFKKDLVRKKKRLPLQPQRKRRETESS
jgi:hypothetical protein